VFAFHDREEIGLFNPGPIDSYSMVAMSRGDLLCRMFGTVPSFWRGPFANLAPVFAVTRHHRSNLSIYLHHLPPSRRIAGGDGMVHAPAPFHLNRIANE
jgi:hypothetical protein